MRKGRGCQKREAFWTDHLSYLNGWGKEQHGKSRLVLFRGPGGRKASQEAAEVIKKLLLGINLSVYHFPTFVKSGKAALVVL